MKKIILIILIAIGFCIGLFAQPKPFDPDYYRDTLKVKKLDEHREVYGSLGFPSAVSEWHAKSYPTFFADLFFHKGINLDNINEYKKLGYFRTNDRNRAHYLLGDILNNVFRPIILIGKLTSFRRGFYYDETTFDLIKIIKGRETYTNFPNKIKCYSIAQGNHGELIKNKSEKHEIVDKMYFFNRNGPSIGDEFILYLDTFKKDKISFLNLINNTDENSKNESMIYKEYYSGDVFYEIEADYLDYSISHDINKDKTKGQTVLDELLKKLNVINKLKLR